MLFLGQRKIIVIEYVPRTGVVERWALALGKKDVRFDGILEETVDSSTDL